MWFAFALAACSSSDSAADTAPTFDYPRDDELRVNQLQLLASHNSYHVETTELPEWSYSRDPLDVQAEEQGIRGFELDLNVSTDDVQVYHVETLDEGTTCLEFVDCLQTLLDWSDAHPAHHLLVVTLEMKLGLDQVDEPQADYDLVEEQLYSVWPRDRVVTPDDVQGDAATVHDAVTTTGWPTLGATREKILFAFDNADWSDWASDGQTTTSGLFLFPNAHGVTDAAASAFHILNDPDVDPIADVVGLGELVRTRADSDCEEAQAGDTTRRDLALASGAQIVSTDFPVPEPDTGYVVSIPGGTPSRCNLLTAPTDCTSTDIEDPDFL